MNARVPEASFEYTPPARAIQAEADRAKSEVKIIRNGSRGMFWLEPMVEVATPQGRIAYGPVAEDDVDMGVDEAGADGPPVHVDHPPAALQVQLATGGREPGEERVEHGVHALAFHRVAHRLWNARWTTLARFLSHVSRFLTGIEIHPAARLGRGLFIDHGMGVVIGETAEVGDNVTLLQGVTLGGTSVRREKRHPTLGNNVVVGAGAKIIGAFTIGDNSRIGAGSVVVREVPPNCVVVGVPGRVTYKDGQRVGGIDMNMTDLPDPVSRALEQLMEQIRGLEAEVDSLRKQIDKEAP